MFGFEWGSAGLTEGWAALRSLRPGTRKNNTLKIEHDIPLNHMTTGIGHG